MSQNIILEQTAQKNLRDLAKKHHTVVKRIEAFLFQTLKNSPTPRISGKFLTGGNLAGLWRYQVIKDWRIIADITSKPGTIIVKEIGNRTSVYGAEEDDLDPMEMFFGTAPSLNEMNNQIEPQDGNFNKRLERPF